MSEGSKIAMFNVRIKKLNQDAIIPKYAHKGDAGLDLYSVEEKVLAAGEYALISTGIAISIPQGYEAQVRPKSGLSANFGISVLNTPGTVDSNYRGEIMVILINFSRQSYKIEKGKKIAQMVFNKVEEAVFEEVSELDDTSRGAGGFGSTGLH